MGASEIAGRVCLRIEPNPAYVDVAVERWQRFTGKAAVLEGNGESFDKLRAKGTAFPAGNLAAGRSARKKGPCRSTAQV